MDDDAVPVPPPCPISIRRSPVVPSLMDSGSSKFWKEGLTGSTNYHTLRSSSTLFA